MPTGRKEVKLLLQRLDEPWRLGGELSWQPLHGDASARRYVRLGGFASGASLVAMLLADERARFSEEAMSGPEPEELPFLDMQRALEAAGLPVPRVVASDVSAGVVLLEDVGDTTLARAVHGAGREDRRRRYRQAVELLVDFQARTAGPGPDCIGRRRAFEYDLLRWELDHFLEYLVDEQRGVRLEGEPARVVGQAFDRLAAEIASWPRVLVHRDFQSRNIMLAPRGPVLIDFQDALMGPAVYDLVALLRDSYVVLDDDLLDELIDYYLELCSARDLKRPPADTWRRQFDLQTLQRKLKDAGRFVFIERVKNNPDFLPFIAPSLAYARQAFERLPEYQPCRRVLAAVVEELR
ncbi:MAG: aminoglycoside phosphotransferase [Deltaproteobacteria bacterium]|nr:MAG: aminoglycoside phosphotransferase [Deltaproteobacteria bacterium]